MVSRVVISLLRCLYAGVGIFSVLSSAHAEVTGFELLERSTLADGATFGTHGAYEEITGRVHLAVDPLDIHNKVINDLELAPRNAEGKVEFVAEIALWKPVDITLGNGVTVVDIPNRGGRVITSFNKPAAAAPLGDAFLLREGYAVVWVGWEYDVPNPESIGIEVPSVPGIANSAIAALGFAAVRDVASWIRYDDEAVFNNDYLLSFGLSQSGRFLRNFLYLGFNEDEAGRQVFAGVMPHIAGASRIDLNRRGAEPVSQGQYTATAFPFTDAALTDPVTGVTEGLLDNPRARAIQPKILYTDTGVEYWGGGRAAALTHSLPDGSADISLQDNVRLYLLSSAQHTPGAFPPPAAANGQQRGNPLDYWWHLRALLVALTQWVVADTPPPASRYPLRADSTLVQVARVNFPAIPGVHAIAGLTAGTRIANPLLPGEGGEGAALPLWVPQVDADGNDVAGIRHPELSVPLATYTGWNFTNLERGDPDTLFPLAGSYIPFSVDEATRQASNDPRPSIRARYRDKADFLQQVRTASETLVAGRYLLASDVDAVVQQAGRHWDVLTSGGQ